MHGKAGLLSTVLLLIILAPALGAENPPRLTPAEAQKWRQDLRTMAAQMEKLHKDLYHDVSREKFAAAVQDLDRRIPRLSRPEVIVGLARIVALVGDGHTNLGLVFDAKVGFGYYPIGLYLFKDGLFVYAADPKYASLVGGRVTKVGNAGPDEAMEKVRDLISRDNEMGFRDNAPMLLTVPEVLYAVGLAPSTEAVTIAVEKDGREAEAELKRVPGPRPSGDNWGVGRNFRKLPDWVDARSPEASGALSLWLRDPQEYFWMEYVEESRTLYVQYNGIADKDTETIAEFAKRVYGFADAHPVDRLVIDMRWNNGGNNYLNKPMLLGAIKANKIDQRGKLFVIIGRRTFSAAQNLVNDLEKYTNATFVGEPTAEHPDFFADAARIVLPNSQLAVRASTLWWQDVDPRDKRVWTGPHIAAEAVFDDYRRNSDPAMRAILAYVPRKELTELMLEKLQAGDRAGAVTSYREFKKDPANAYVDTERKINNLGYRLLRMKRVEDAIEVFKLNVESYPHSPNVYDSLAEAYVAQGNKELAIENYEKELKLDPANGPAMDALRKLRAK